MATRATKPLSIAEQELNSFVRQTRLDPTATLNRVLREIDELFANDWRRQEVRAHLAGESVRAVVQARSAGSFADHAIFRQSMLAAAAEEETYLAYMRFWLGGELYFGFPEQFDRLPVEFKRAQAR